jgi:ribosomal protein S18 acetylase RimI-like enzyme
VPQVLTDRAEVRALLRRHPQRHLLAIGDLDDAFWPQTRFLHGSGQTLMIYTGLQTPVVLAVADPPEPAMAALAEACAGLLPDRFYGHLSGSAVDGLRAAFDVDVHATHAYMAVQPSTLTPPGTALAAGDEITPIGEEQLGEIVRLQAAANPGGGFFEAGMLRSGPYLGVRRKGELVAMAGTHTWSAAERVAVLGNIATHPDHRRQGLAAAVTAALCAKLAESADLIGLTVDVANVAAVKCYAGLGFTEDVTIFGAYCTRRG